MQIRKSVAARPRIAAVVVNCNTRELLPHLFCSLGGVVDNAVELGPIVMVDNNSTVGSVALINQLAGLELFSGSSINTKVIMGQV